MDKWVAKSTKFASSYFTWQVFKKKFINKVLEDNGYNIPYTFPVTSNGFSFSSKVEASREDTLTHLPFVF